MVQRQNIILTSGLISITQKPSPLLYYAFVCWCLTRFNCWFGNIMMCSRKRRSDTSTGEWLLLGKGVTDWVEGGHRRDDDGWDIILFYKRFHYYDVGRSVRSSPELVVRFWAGHLFIFIFIQNAINSNLLLTSGWWLFHRFHKQCNGRKRLCYMYNTVSQQVYANAISSYIL